MAGTRQQAGTTQRASFKPAGAPGGAGPVPRATLLPVKPAANPFVPARVLSVPSQRCVLVLVFAALQLRKLWTAAAQGPGASRFAWYTLLDATFVNVLPILRVPWLQFSRWFVWVQICALIVTDIALFIDPRLLGFFWALIWGVFGDSLSLSGKLVPSKPPLNLGAQHLPGIYSIKYLPESSATLLVDEPLCLLPHSQKKHDEVYVHLVLDSAQPTQVVLGGLDFDAVASGVQEPTFRVEFGSRELKKLYSRTDAKKKDVKHVWLPLTRPGLYRLESVTDGSSQLPVRVYGEPAPVPPCPSASLIDISGSLCVGDTLAASINVTGLAPLTVLLGDGTTLKSDRSASEYSLETQTVYYTRTVGGTAATVALKNVTDALGNNLLVGDEESRTVDVFTNSQAQFAGPGGQHVYALVDDQVHVPVTVSGRDAPFELTYRANETLRKVVFSSPGRHTLSLDAPGTYALQDMRGTVCAGKVLDPKVKVFVPPPVQLGVEFEQVEDKCSGPRGINVDVTLEGTPPFEVTYRTIQDGRVLSTQTLKTQKHKDRVQFKPHTIGNFAYEFVSVRDKYRSANYYGVPGYQQQQVISELAGAAFGQPLVTRYCPGDLAYITAKVQGKNPLSLTYSVDDEKRVQSGIDGDVTLLLGELAGGTHVVRLQSIEDVRGCVTPLDMRSPDIHVRGDRPFARLSGDSVIKVAELNDPPLKLPLIIENGVPPYRIQYRVNGGDLREHVTNVAELPVTEVGTYSLDGFRDDCPGVVGREEVTVSLYERPKLILGAYNASTCVGSSARIALEATGHPPFRLSFERVNPAGRVHYEEHESASGNFVIDIPPQSVSGVYTNRFWLTDKVYTRVAGAEPLTVAMEVHAEPYAAFAKPKSRYEVCEAASRKPTIPLKLRGRGPYTITFEAENKGTGRKFKTRAQVPDVRTYELADIFDEVTTGTFELRVVGVTDGHGCSFRAPQSDANKVYIVTSPAPKLAEGEPLRQHYCAGDSVSLSLLGQGLFNIEYVFNGKKQRSDTRAAFSRLASLPGKFELVSLGDDSGCRRNLTGLASIIVHALPHSRITSKPNWSVQKGDVVDLHFEFTGEPPFTFTYTRSVNGRVKSKKTVKNVETNTYVLSTTEEGEYEVIALRDAHCGVKR